MYHQGLSDYGYAVMVQREQLVSSLISSLLDLQLGDPGYEELLDSSLRGLQHHQFLDTNPSEVEDLYSRLRDRLGEWAKFDKQRALALLQCRLQGLDLPSAQYDFQHRLLAFLYSASRSVLNSEYKGSALVDRLAQEAQAAGQAQPTYLSDSTASGSWASGQYQQASGSHSQAGSLSDWDEEGKGPSGRAAEDGEEVTSRPAANGIAAHGGGAQSSSPANDSLPATPATPDPHRVGAAARAGQLVGAAGDHSAVHDRRWQLARLVPPPRPSPYQRTSLAVWLAAKQSGGHPARVLNPHLCFTEVELLQQVLHMLQGVVQPGLAFQLDPVRGTYAVPPGVHMHSTSPASTWALLQRLADLGSALRAVQEFCGGMLAPGSLAAPVGSSQGGLSAGFQQQQQQKQGEAALAGEELSGDAERLRQLPTVAAFAAALDAQLKALHRQLIPLEVAARSGALSLLQLHHQLEGFRRQALVLQSLARQCVWRGGAAETAAGLLEATHDTVQGQMLLAASQGGALAAMALQIFTASAKPYLDRLHLWVYNGDLSDDVLGELCIAADPSIPPTSSRFWASAYRLRQAGDGTPVVPAFLLPLADSLLAAGKSAVLLKASAEQAAAAPVLQEPAPVEQQLQDAATSGRGGSAGAGGRLASQPSWRSIGPCSLAPAAGTPSQSQQQTQHQQQAQQQAQQQGLRVRLSPTKRRLNAINALPYDLATTVTPRAVAHPAAAATPDLLPPSAATGAQALLVAAREQDGLAQQQQQQPALHGCFVSSLQELMQPAAGGQLASGGQGLGSLSAASCQQQQQQQQQQPAEPAAKYAGIGPEPHTGFHGEPEPEPEGGVEGAEEDEEEDWLGAAAACNSHTLSIGPGDDLPLLQPLPRTALQLQIPQAVINPDALPAPAWACAGVPPSGCDAVVAGSSMARAETAQEQPQQQGQQKQQSWSQQQGLSMGDRMRQAAWQRVQQASGEGGALGQLPALLQPPAALGQAGLAQGGAALCREEGEQTLQAALGAAVDFESSSWANWYRRLSSALSSQLAAIDAGLGGGTQWAPAGGEPALALCDQARGHAPSLACGTGSAMWLGRPRLGQQGEQLGISPAMCAHAQSLDSLLQQSLLSPLQLQAQRIGAALTSSLLQQWGLRRQLLTLREVFMLGSNLMLPFVEGLLLRISSRQGLGGVSEFDLNSSLQESFLSEGRTDLVSITGEILPQEASSAGKESAASTAAVAPAAVAAVGSAPAAAGGAAAAAGAAMGQGPGLPTVRTLSRLRLGVDCGWPLCLMVSEEMLLQYNAMLVLLLQVRWVKRSLDSLQRNKWKGAAGAHSAPDRPSSTSDAGQARAPVAPAGQLAEGEGGGEGERQARLALRLSERDGVLHQMAHLADAVRQYTGERLLAAWQWFQEALAGCQSLDELQRCHAKYLRAAQRYCLLGQDTLARLVHDALLRLLDCALHYCWLSAQLARVAGAASEATRQGPTAAAVRQQREAALRAQLAGVRREFSSRQRLLVRVLASRAGEVGVQAGEMLHLLTALDYNSFFQQTA